MRAFLLVEHAGPWGEDALRDARLPDGPGCGLRRRAADRCADPARPAPPPRADSDDVRVFAATPTRSGRGWRRRRSTDLDEVLDLDLGALGAGRSPGLAPTDGRCSACAPTAGTTPAAPSTAGRSPRHSQPRTPRRPGRSRTSAVTGSPATCSSCRTGSTTAGSTPRRSRVAGRTSPAGSTSTSCVAGATCRCRRRPPRSPYGAPSASRDGRGPRARPRRAAPRPRRLRRCRRDVRRRVRTDAAATASGSPAGRDGTTPSRMHEVTVDRR